MTRFLNILLVGLFGTYFYMEYRETNAVDAATPAPALVTRAAVDADAELVNTSDTVRVALATDGGDDMVVKPAAPVMADSALSAAEIAKARALFDAKVLTASPVEVAAVAAPEPAPAPVVLRVTGSLVNARSGPGTGFDVVTKLTRGTELFATDDSEGDWAKVLVVETGEEVWMHANFLAQAG